MSSIFDHIRNDDLESIKRLFEKDPDIINIIDHSGWSPLHQSVYCNNNIITTYLISKGVDIETKDDRGFTPLHLSIFKSNSNMFVYLISMGANVNTQDIKNETPLHDSIRINDLEFTKLLLERGADPYIKDNNGKTPLDCCKVDQKEEILNMIRMVKLKDLYK